MTEGGWPIRLRFFVGFVVVVVVAVGIGREIPQLSLIVIIAGGINRVYSNGNIPRHTRELNENYYHRYNPSSKVTGLMIIETLQIVLGAKRMGS